MKVPGTLIITQRHYVVFESLQKCEKRVKILNSNM